MGKKELGLMIFSLVLCGNHATSVKSALLRIKRWHNSGDMSEMFRGTAGVDYPDLKSIPSTNFRCQDQILYEGGLYADIETRCQVYHVCHDGRKDSFICGKGTIFNQQILACDYWYSTDCESAPSFYYLNSQIGSSLPEGNQPGHSSYNNNGQTNTAVKNYDINNNQPPSSLTGSTSQRNVHNDPKSCHCLQSSYKTAWSFPTSLPSGKVR